jgi:hypothetical protein
MACNLTSGLPKTRSGVAGGVDLEGDRDPILVEEIRGVAYPVPFADQLVEAPLFQTAFMEMNPERWYSPAPFSTATRTLKNGTVCPPHSRSIACPPMTIGLSKKSSFER